MKSPSPEIQYYNDHISPKFDRHLGSATAEVPDKFQSDWKSLNANLVAWRFDEMLREDILPVSEQRLWYAAGDY